jgi:GR25 family glycosyltransferase involved in LPS biosynthesis
MHLNTFFADIPIYVINLQDSVDRRTHVQRQFGPEVKVTFVPAVDGRRPGSFYNDYLVSFQNNRSNFSTSLIAVICSHIRAIYTAYHNRDQYAIILEDDVWTDLIPSCSFTMKDICNLPGDWELIQLFYSSHDIIKSNHAHFQKQGLQLLPRSQNYSGTCYVINRMGMEKILNQICNYDGQKMFIIHRAISDPESMLFDNTKTLVLNRPIFFYYFSSMTFDNYYSIDNPENSKKDCQVVHLNTANLLRSLYGN